MFNAASIYRHTTHLASTLLAASLLIVGCQSDAPPPKRVAVPSDNLVGPVRQHPDPKPVFVEPIQADIPLPIDDPPLITQAPPEQPQFLEAYERVGRPRIVVFVNRTIDGNIIGTAEPERIGGISVTAQTRGPGDDFDGDYSASAEVFLPPGKYDEVQAKAIDYEAMELVIGDLLAANGRVLLISPIMARTKLTDGQIKQIQSGEPTALRLLAETLDTDVLIQVQARPTQQSQNGLGVRVLAEAIDVANGDSLARAFVDIPPPLTKTTLQKYSRYLSRKLMHNLAGAWRYAPGNNSIPDEAPRTSNAPPVQNPTASPQSPKDAPTLPPEPTQPPTP